VFLAISKKILGVSASSKGSVNPLFGVKEDAIPCAAHLWRPHLATGTVIKITLGSKIVEQVFFSVLTCPWAGVVPLAQRVCAPFAIPHCHRSSPLEKGK